MRSVSFDTLTLSSKLEYKYILVAFTSGSNHLKIIDLGTEENTKLNFLLEQGWEPVRERQFSSAGDSAGVSILILLGREAGTQGS